MSDSIIAQVRALANCNAYDYQGGHYDADGRRIPIPNWSALLAHLERTQAVVEIAVAINQGYKNDIYKIAAKDKQEHALAEEFFDALDAALENLENRDTKAGG